MLKENEVIGCRPSGLRLPLTYTYYFPHTTFSRPLARLISPSLKEHTSPFPHKTTLSLTGPHPPSQDHTYPFPIRLHLLQDHFPHRTSPTPSLIRPHLLRATSLTGHTYPFPHMTTPTQDDFPHRTPFSHRMPFSLFPCRTTLTLAQALDILTYMEWAFLFSLMLKLPFNNLRIRQSPTSNWYVHC